jgi:glycosyltransferase involved in cell wall biosynthesis
VTTSPSDRSIRILHTIYSLAGAGAERQLSLLVRSSVGTSCEMGIFFVNDAGVDQEVLGVKAYRSRTSNRFNVGVFASLHRAIGQFRPDIIHTWLPPSITIPSMVLAGLHGLPCIFSYRNAMSFQRGLQLPELALAWLCADGVVSNNPIGQSARAYRRLYEAKNGTVIQNAVAVDDMPTARGNAGQHARFEIVFVGRITTQKNWPCLVRALCLLPPHVPWHLTVCGDGEQRAQMVRMVAEEGLSDRVSMLGYRRDVYALMDGADVLVLPSLYEGMPNVLLEGLAMRIPCVISDIPAHRFVVDDRDCVRLFDPASPAQLAERLSDAFHNPQLSIVMAQKGIAVAEGFSPSRMFHEYVALYRNILSG